MTKNREMTEKMQAILDYITSNVEVNGYPPTVREVCDEFDIKSTASAHYYLKKLENLGCLIIDKNKSRAMGISNKEDYISKDMVKVAHIGTIPAGVPKLAYEDYMDIYHLPKDIFSASGELFMLDVVGTSMINDGIFEGDRIIVRSQNTANNGEIVVAMLDGENCTVKRFYKEADHIKLVPANDLMKPIYSRDVIILGKVIGLIRNI